MNLAAMRKRSQRSFPIDGESCQLCGSKKRVQRHHPNQDPEVFWVVCQKCHTDIHMKEGSWGKGLKKIRACVICGKEFLPSHSKRNKTCSKNCLSELGRINARKRWQKTEADLEGLETQ